MLIICNSGVGCCIKYLTGYYFFYMYMLLLTLLFSDSYDDSDDDDCKTKLEILLDIAVSYMYWSSPLTYCLLDFAIFLLFDVHCLWWDQL
jgi:hypothetical protein